MALIQSGEATVIRYFSLICTFYHSHFRAGSLIADHAVVSNQTNSHPNVIAAVDNLVNGGSTVTIQGVSAGATSASIRSGTNIGNI